MKPITLLIKSLFATASLALAEGIPVDHDTGKVTMPHTIVSLTPEQIEETQTLGTFTLTPEQWRKIRAKSPQCPKRFHTVLPVTWNDCACGVEEEYVIALSRDRIAVLGYADSSASVESVRRELFKNHRVTSLRMNERGEFYAGGKLVPFPTLLKALATPPNDAKRNEAGSLVVTATEDGREFSESRWLVVELPVGAKPTDAVFESRLRQIASAADQMGLSHVLFP
jgi:hypothetical protein